MAKEGGEPDGLRVRRQIDHFLGFGLGDEDDPKEVPVPTVAEAATHLRKAAIFFLDRHNRTGSKEDKSEADQLLNLATLLDP